MYYRYIPLGIEITILKIMNIHYFGSSHVRMYVNIIIKTLSILEIIEIIFSKFYNLYFKDVFELYNY